MTSRKGLLILLEGQALQLPSPKNHYSNDVCINKDTISYFFLKRYIYWHSLRYMMLRVMLRAVICSHFHELSFSGNFCSPLFLDHEKA